VTLTEIRDVVSSIVVRNPRTQNIVLCVEPWGDELTLAPGVSYRILVTGPSNNNLQLEFPEHGVAIYAWNDSILTVFDGDSIVREYPIRVPPLPNSTV
jgi:hypothetical protein